ncbi:MAG TPA: helix-turn-helix transcriptional regulator [Pseudonocardiaceae bacterium]
MNELPDERRRMADALRGLRVEAGLSTTQLAHRLGWSQSKVSKTERGVTLPPPSDVEAWAQVTGAPADLRAELIEIAKHATAEFIEWRRFLAPGRRRIQQDVQRLEAAASVLRVFAPNVVVGLAQTRRYAEAIFRIGWGGPAENADDVVRARLARQAVLANESKRFELTMGEAALRRCLIPPAAMRAQLIRLVELSQQPNVHISVILFDAAEKVHQYHGYSVIGDPDLDSEALVTAETLTRALMVRREDEIREYIEHFNALRVASTEGEPLRAFLHELIAELPEG